MSGNLYTSDSHSALLRLRMAAYLVRLWTLRVEELHYSIPATLRLQSCRVELEKARLKAAEYKRLDVSSMDDFNTIVNELTNHGIGKPDINFVAGTVDVLGIMQQATQNGYIVSTENPGEQISHVWCNHLDSILPQPFHNRVLPAVLLQPVPPPAPGNINIGDLDQPAVPPPAPGNINMGDLDQPFPPAAAFDVNVDLDQPAVPPAAWNVNMDDLDQPFPHAAAGHLNIDLNQPAVPPAAWNVNMDDLDQPFPHAAVGHLNIDLNQPAVPPAAWNVNMDLDHPFPPAAAFNVNVDLDQPFPPAADVNVDLDQPFPLWNYQW